MSKHPPQEILGEIMKHCKLQDMEDHTATKIIEIYIEMTREETEVEYLQQRIGRLRGTLKEIATNCLMYPNQEADARIHADDAEVKRRTPPPS